MNELNKNGLVHPKRAKKLSLSSQKRAIKPKTEGLCSLMNAYQNEDEENDAEEEDND